MEYRKKVLNRLTELEQKVDEELISKEERELITQIWVEETADLALKMASEIEVAE
jgi:hypothetical protein